MQAQSRQPVHPADGPVRDGIPEHGRIPRYYAVKVELLELIAELGQGAALPTERELCERFEVSRATVQQAENRRATPSGARSVLADMRWKATLAGAGLVLIAGTACASPAKNDSQHPAARQQPNNAAAPAKPATRLPPGQLDASALPEGYPNEVSVGNDGRGLVIKAQEGGCGRASVEPQEQNAQRVVLNLVETTAQGNQMCTMDIRFPTLSAQLTDPLGGRIVVLHSEQRKK